MIRHLLIALCLLGLVRGEEPTLADIVPGLSAEEFKDREAAMAKIKAYTDAHPRKSLKELPPLLRKINDPEAKLRLRKIALDLLKIKTTKSLFGFTFLPRPGLSIEGKATTGVSIFEVIDDFPAKRAGLKDRDIIFAINGKLFPKNCPEEDLRKIFASQEPDKQVTLSVLRGGNVIELGISPQEAPLEPEVVRERLLLYENWLREGGTD